MRHNTFTWTLWAYKAEGNARQTGERNAAQLAKKRSFECFAMFFAALWEHDWAQGYQLTYPEEMEKDIKKCFCGALRCRLGARISF
jgi:hypothetical protein